MFTANRADLKNLQDLQNFFVTRQRPALLGLTRGIGPFPALGLSNLT